MTQPHIMVLGLRGFPAIQGGVETHCEHLFPLVAEAGVRVTIIGRSPYLGPDHVSPWKGVYFARIWAPKSKKLEALVHTFLGVLYAAVKRPDILHIQTIGPALMTPLARLLGLKVVVTHHGPDYDRQKWGGFAKFVLRKGEAAGMIFAHRRIVISETIRSLVRSKFGRDSLLIRNGVNLPTLPDSIAALEKFALTPRRYILLVSRLVPEKRHLDLIEAFTRAQLPGWKLVLVGGSDHPDAYSRQLEKKAAESKNVVMTGVQTGLALAELYAHAGIFALPSSHEGLPIVLLEALSYGLSVVASDIPANLEVSLPPDHYFHLSDIADLAAALARFAPQSLTPETSQAIQRWVVARYNWRQIAEQTLAVYRNLLDETQPLSLSDPNTGTDAYPGL